MIAIIFIFGLIIGSFLNSVIYRLREGGNIVTERSHCPHCRQQLKWYELIPLFSFIIQLGYCRSCHRKIDWQYPLVELATAILFSIAFFKIFNIPNFQLLTPSFQLFRDFFIISILVVIFVYDLRWQLIPDKLTLPAIGIVVFINFIVLSTGNNLLANWLVNLLVAIVVGGGFFLLQFIVSKGRWIGGGDIRLGVLMGVILGWPQVAWALMLAYILGALVAVGLILTGQKKWSAQIPFGTFLTVAAFITMYWSDQIVNWYVNLIL